MDIPYKYGQDDLKSKASINLQKRKTRNRTYTSYKYLSVGKVKVNYYYEVIMRSLQ